MSPVPTGDIPSLFSSRRRRLLTGRHSRLVSSLSTVVVLGVLSAIVFYAPGGVAFRHFFFDPHQMWIALVGSHQGLASVGKGIVTNVWMFSLCEVLVLIFVGLRRGRGTIRPVRSSGNVSDRAALLVTPRGCGPSSALFLSILDLE